MPQTLRQRQQRNLALKLTMRIRKDMVALEHALKDVSYSIANQRIHSIEIGTKHLRDSMTHHKHSPYSIDDFIRRENV